MEAVQLFSHSIRQVFGNFPAALRLSAAVYLARFLLLLTIDPALTAVGMFGDGVDTSDVPIPTLLFATLVSMACILIIAVNWHRFVLNNEPSTLMPRIHIRQILNYLGRCVFIALVSAGVVFLAGLVMAAFFSIISGSFDAYLAVELLLGAFTVFITALALYLSVTLPAMALGRRMSLSEGRRAMRGHFGTLLILSLLLVGIQFVLETVVGRLAISMPIVILLNLIMGWVYLMVGLSILTTLYGHYVEGRPLR